MSIVMNLVCDSASWVVSDGRAIYSDDNSIISESVEKVRMVNERVCVGFTGTHAVAVKMMEALNVPLNLFQLKTAKSDEVAERIRKILTASRLPKEYYTNYIVTGLNSRAHMSSYTVKSENVFEVHEPSEKAPFKFTILCSGKAGIPPESYLLPMFRGYLLSGEIDREAVISAMKRYVLNVAAIDDTVNTNLNLIELRKDGVYFNGPLP